MIVLNSCEAVLVFHKLKKKSLLILEPYRPPNTDRAINVMHDMLGKALKVENPRVLLGDINVSNMENRNDKVRIRN